MPSSSRDDDLLLIAARWLAASAALVLAGAAVIWFDMSGDERQEQRRSFSQHLEDEEPELALGADAESGAHDTPWARPRFQRPTRQAALERVETGDEGSEIDGDEEPTEAQKEADRYAENEQKFNDRLEQLERELEEGKGQQATDEALAARLSETLSQHTKLPAQFQTRCTEGVCELSFVGEGTAIDFAMSAASGLMAVASSAARGPASSEVHDGFNADEAIQPPAVEDAGEQDESELMEWEKPKRKLHSIRYLIDVADLKLEEGSEDAPTEVEPSVEEAAPEEAAE